MTAEQDRAADPATSAWVAASAGTGKTHVLTSRVLRLMLAGADPAKILCVTFTKAAAAEMANRINDRLASWAILDDRELAKKIRELGHDAPDSETIARARRLFAEVLELPGGLRIDTIHAFCQSLMARFPLEAGIAPHFTIADERTSATLFYDATLAALAQAQSVEGTPLAGAVERIASMTTELGFQDLLGSLGAERQKILDLLRRFPESADIETHIHGALGLQSRESEDDIVARACEDSAFDRDGLVDAAAALATGGKTDQARGQAIADWLESPGERAAGFDPYASQFLTASGDARARLVTKAVTEKHPNAEDTLRQEAVRLIAVMEGRRLARVAGLTSAMLLFAKQLFATYEAAKRAQGMLDYDDLIAYARDLIAGPASTAWVLYKLDDGLDHILVDEAQDTNPLQWQIVDALASEFLAGEGTQETTRTVFAVGDAKQSIYGFQHAEPAEFDRMRHEFRRRCDAANLRFHDGVLNFSFRSTEAVLGLVDAVFADEGARRGLGNQDGDVLRHEAARAGVGGLVELWETEAPQPEPEPEPWEPPITQRGLDDPEARLAARIAGQIGHWLDSGETMESTGQPIKPGDVLILVRRRNRFFSAMVKELKRRHIRVAGMDRMILGDQLAVMDLMALARFTLTPDDDLTLAVVLKSPLVGLSEDQLYALAHGRPGSLWQALGAKQSETDFRAAHDFLAACLRGAGALAPFEFFSQILDREGGRRKLVARLGEDCLDPLDEFLSLSLDFERSAPPSLQGFLHWMDASHTQVKREMEQGRNEVRVMTVHGAKGLQAPIVFLPDTCMAPSQTPSFLWLDDAKARSAIGPVMIWPGRAENVVGSCRVAREREVIKRDEEYNRQLYVALTRAADRLYITGYESSRGRSNGCWYDRIAAGFDRLSATADVQAFDGEPVRRYHAGGSVVEGEDETADETAAQTPLPDWASIAPAPEPQPTRPLMPSRLGESDKPVLEPGKEQKKYQRGTLIHRLLELLPALPEAQRESAATQFLSQPAYGLDAATVSAWAGEALSIIKAPEFARLFAPGSLAEAPLVGTIGTTGISGQVDRLVISDKEVLVVDYKSNLTVPSGPDSVPTAYVRQMAAYREILRNIYPDRPVRCALLWTAEARLMPLGEADLDREATQITST